MLDLFWICNHTSYMYMYSLAHLFYVTEIHIHQRSAYDVRLSLLFSNGELADSRPHIILLIMCRYPMGVVIMTTKNYASSCHNNHAHRVSSHNQQYYIGLLLLTGRCRYIPVRQLTWLTNECGLFNQKKTMTAIKIINMLFTHAMHSGISLLNVHKTRIKVKSIP